MPVVKAGSGYRFGQSGKTYTGPGAKAKAEAQQRAAYASGYKGSKPKHDKGKK